MADKLKSHAMTDADRAAEKPLARLRRHIAFIDVASCSFNKHYQHIGIKKTGGKTVRFETKTSIYIVPRWNKISPEYAEMKNTQNFSQAWKRGKDVLGPIGDAILEKYKVMHNGMSPPEAAAEKPLSSGSKNHRRFTNCARNERSNEAPKARTLPRILQTPGPKPAARETHVKNVLLDHRTFAEVLKLSKNPK